MAGMVKGHTIRRILILSVIAIVLTIVGPNLTGRVRAAEVSLPQLTEIYPNAVGTNESGAEFIELYNPGSTAVELNQYQLQVKDEPHKSMVLNSSLEPQQYKAFTTSFNLRNDGDVIQLIHHTTQSEVIEEISYGPLATEEQSWSYFTDGWRLATPTPDVPNQVSEVPESCVVEIAEISAQPNLNGQEYIEVINTSDQPARLSNCQLSINGSSEQPLQAGGLSPGSRHIQTFSNGSIRNDGGSITLVNTNNQELVYNYGATNAGQVINFNTGSQAGSISDKPTPGTTNETVLLSDEEIGGRGGLAECGTGKFRNPATNRCKTIETDDASLAPCASDQQRNPETNRCRKATVASASLTPCQSGQERNPVTNRCRKTGGETSLKPCEPGQERNPETNRCRKTVDTVDDSNGLASTTQTAALSPFKYKLQIIGAVLAALLAYGAYEYRTDLRNFVHNIRNRLTHSGPPR